MQKREINNASECCLIIYGGNGVKKKKGQLEEEIVEEKGLTSKGKMFLHSRKFLSLPVEHRKQTAISVIACSKRKEASTFQKVPKK